MTSDSHNKKNMNEQDASSLFVDLTLGTLSRFWNEGLANDIEKTLNLKNNLKDNARAKFEFAMAFLALQMNTLFKRLDHGRAKRMRNFVFNYLNKSMNYDKYATELIKKYEKIISDYPSFNYPAKYNIPPLGNLSEAIGIALADAFGGKPTIDIEGETFYNIFSICILGDTLLTFSTDWNWKSFLESICLNSE